VGNAIQGRVLEEGRQLRLGSCFGLGAHGDGCGVGMGMGIRGVDHVLIRGGI